MSRKSLLPSRMLVIHDDGSCREFFLELLRTHGYQMLKIPGTPEALGISEWGVPVQVKGFLIYDIRQPNLHGISLQDFIKNPAARVPFVILAGVEAGRSGNSPLGRLAGVLSYNFGSRISRLVGWMSFCG